MYQSNLQTLILLIISLIIGSNILGDNNQEYSELIIEDPKSEDSTVTMPHVSPTEQLPHDYVPENLTRVKGQDIYLTEEAAMAFEDLIAAARKDGVNITAVSGFRHYNSQVSTFQKWVNFEIAKGFGKEEAKRIADTYSARPGHSQHQTGNAVDLAHPSCIHSDEAIFGTYLCSANGLVYSWLKENAQKYGFLIPYLKDPGKKGHEEAYYKAEPWHLLYVGKEAAEACAEYVYIMLDKCLLVKGVFEEGVFEEYVSDEITIGEKR